MIQRVQSMSTGEVARASGVKLATIRFYERVGLLKSPPRRPSGYRAYPPETVGRILFIRTAKDLGFSLEEIRELLSLRVHPVGSCAGARAMATEKIRDIEARVRTLQRMRRILRSLVEACDAKRPTTECPILEALEHEANP